MSALFQIVQLIAPVLITLGTVAAARAVAQRFQKLGGGEAQDRLNSIRKELDDAMTQKVQLLEEQFTGCKARLVSMEKTVAKLSEERIDLKQEIADLHDELRTLRPNRRGRLDRASD